MENECVIYLCDGVLQYYASVDKAQNLDDDKILMSREIINDIFHSVD